MCEAILADENVRRIQMISCIEPINRRGVSCLRSGDGNLSGHLGPFDHAIWSGSFRGTQLRLIIETARILESSGLNEALQQERSALGPIWRNQNWF